MDSALAKVTLQRFWRDYLRPGDPGASLRDFLRKTADPTTTALDLADSILADPALADQFLRIDTLRRKVSEWSAEEAKAGNLRATLVRRLCGLLGKSAVRNAVTAIRLMQIAGKPFPKKDEEPIRVLTSEMLRHAVAAEEFSDEHHLAAGASAFFAGMHFDLLLAVLGARKEISADVKSAVTESWRRSLLAGRLATTLGMTPKNFAYADRVFAAAVCLGTGPVWATALYAAADAPGGGESYAAFAKETAKQAAGGAIIGPEAGRLRETSAFAWLPAELAGLQAGMLGLVADIEPALAISGAPYVLGSGTTRETAAARTLAVILHSAFNLARGAKSKATLNAAQLALLAGVGITESQVAEAMRATATA